MNNDKKSALKKPLTSPVQISKAPPPITPLRGGGYIPPVARTLPRDAWKQPNWNKWKHMHEMKPWQACALALNFDPDSLELPPHEYMTAYVDDEFQIRSFPSDKVSHQHADLLQILADNRCKAEFFTHHNNFKDPVLLSEFAAWCAPVVRDLTDRDIPPELAALAKAAPQAAPLVEATPTTKVEAGAGTSPSGEDKPWLVANPSDPEPDYSWYTPARHFARKLVKDDLTLLVKKAKLAEKTAASLTGVGIFKRGKKKLPLSASTVLKSFVNVTLD